MPKTITNEKRFNNVAEQTRWKSNTLTLAAYHAQQKSKQCKPSNHDINFLQRICDELEEMIQSVKDMYRSWT